MNRAKYNALMAKGEAEGLTQAEFDAVKAFAQAKRIRQPKADWVKGAVEAPAGEPAKPAKQKAAKKAAAPKAPKEPKVKATCNPALFDSEEECDKASRSNGLCPAHYSRLVYRGLSEENAEKVRKASREYAARQRAAKAKAASAA